jgi:hypothetical protein
MTDWIMIAITSVYVVATILICIFNYRSAKATREQVAEAKRQFDETNRAFVTVNLESIRGGLIVLCIKNHGKMIANNVKVRFEEEYIKNFSSRADKSSLVKLNQASFSIGIGQSWYICLGSHLDLEEMSKQLLHLVVSYNDKYNTYSDNIDINFGEYFWSLIYDSILGDIYGEIKKEKEIFESIEKHLDKMKNLIMTAQRNHS